MDVHRILRPGRTGAYMARPNGLQRLETDDIAGPLGGGVLDFLLIDMPPGTGDIHISLIGDIPMEGAVIVTTPQAVALADVEKGVDMFRNAKVNKKLFGLVENMAWFTPEELPQNKYYIFGRDGGVKMASRFDMPLLGQIPIVQGIRECGDSGEPIALSSRPDAVAFLDLAQRLAAEAES